MDRRSFLSLLVASPLLARLGELELERVAPPIVLPPQAANPLLGSVAERPSLRERVRMMVMPFAPDEGFGHVIEAGRIARFVALPQLPFRPDRLMIAEPDFDILGVSTAGEPQLEESVPSELFGVTALGARLEFQTAAPGQLLVMAVRNRGATRAFNAAFVGRTVYELSGAELAEERERDADFEEWEAQFDDDQIIDDEDGDFA